jgi:hypothetical protein
MFDINAEPPVPLSVAAAEITNRRGDRGINPATIWRWATQGCRGVLLESTLIGGVRMTSRESLNRFFERLTAQANQRAAAAPSTKGEAR